MSSSTSSSSARTVGLAALLLGLSTILSRLLGYARDAVLAAQLGATAETDAYHAAFLLPDMLLYFLVGGALSLAFLPLFQRLREREGEEAAWRLFGTLAGTGGVVLGVLLALGWWQAPWLVARLMPEFGDEQLALTVHLTRIMLPTPLFFFWGGLLGATEMASGRFRSSALAPLVYNLCIILGGLLLAPRMGVDGFVWGVLIGAILGPFGVQLLWARRHLRLRLAVDLRSPELHRYLFLALPLMIGASLTTVDEWLGRLLASGMESGSITWLNNARRLMLVPVSMVGQAIGVAALPYLSLLVQRRQEEELARQLGEALRGTALLALVGAVGLGLIATPAAGLVYGRGAYTPQDVLQTGHLLIWLCGAVVPWCVHTVAVRAFYAREDTWTPMLASSVAVAIALPIYLLLLRRFELAGLAAATTAGMSLQVLLNALVYRWKHGGDLLMAPLRGSLHGLLIAAPGTLAAFAVLRWAPLDAEVTGTSAVIRVLAVGATYGLPTLLLLLLTGGPAASALRRRLPGRLRRLG